MTNAASEFIDSPFNFRDFGDVVGQGDAAVARNMLYRAGQQAMLSETAIYSLHAIHFDLIVDLRYPGERRAAPSPWPPGWSDRVVAHHVESDDRAPHLAIMTAASGGAAAVEAAYRELYRRLPFDPVYRPLFAAALRRIADASGPVLIHCSAGKDRTGMLVALLLDTLGVDRGDIEADYLRSNEAPALHRLRDDLAVRLAADGTPDPVATAHSLVGVDASYLRSMFAAIGDRDGGVANYLAASDVPASAIHALRARLLAR